MRWRGGWIRASAFVALGAGGVGCHVEASGAPVAECSSVDASACPAQVPSYTNDVAPLLDRECNNTCHAPGAGPWPLTDRQSLIDWTDLIVRDTENCSMPPPDAGALTTGERDTIVGWFACGAPNN